MHRKVKRRGQGEVGAKLFHAEEPIMMRVRVEKVLGTEKKNRETVNKKPGIT